MEANIQEKPTYVSREEKLGLTKELLHEFFDYKDGFLYWKKQTTVRIKIGDKVGSVDWHGYRMTGLYNKRHSVARLIFFWNHGYLLPVIDHINNNRNDDRIENLRGCTQYQNTQNCSSTKGSSSQYLGVGWDATRNKWRSQISINFKNTFIGRFDTEEEASLSYNEVALKHRGEFANLNIIKKK